MDCPTDDLLIQFAAGMLTEAAREPIRVHLATCDSCAKKIAWFRAELFDDIDDDVASRTKGMASQDSLDEAEPPTDRSAFEDSFDFAMLAPAQNAESLGRLGKYEIHGVIGDGAMGIVLKAFEESLQRTVAIKVLKRQVCTSDRARRRFIREARAAAGISHPNVVTIFAVDEERACPYLVMEYVAGGTLRELIRKKGSLPPMEVVRLAKGVAEGLAAAHRQGVIHRDIKPGNLLLERGAVRVKITDFGLARAAVDNVDLTSHGLAVGTPAYMSPEQVTGQRLDPRTDLFSLGCVIYAMVAGRSPFRGGNQFEVARRILNEVPVPLDQLVEGTPPLLAELTQRLLAKNPEDRFPSADALAEELEHYLALLNEAPTDEMSGIMRQARLHFQGQPPAESARDLGPDSDTAPQPVLATATLPAPESQPDPERRRGARRAMAFVAAIAAAIVLLAGLAIWQPWRAGTGPAGIRGTRPDPGPGAAKPLVHDPSAAPKLILVGDPGQRPDCVATINEALGLAGPGTVIRILPMKEYRETIVIDDPSRLRGIVIEGDPGGDVRPLLVGTDEDPESAMLAIRGVSGVVVRHLELRANGSRCIAIEGPSHEVMLERLRCVQRYTGGGPAVDIHATAAGENTAPITLRGSEFDCPGAGQCLRLGHPERLQETVVQDNTFRGRGVLVLAELGMIRVTICGNTFMASQDTPPENAYLPPYTVALNLDVTAPAIVQRIEVCNNTFLDLKHWLGLVHSVTGEPLDVRFCNNLILGSESIQDQRNRLDEIARNWMFRNNVWEVVPGSGGWNPEFWSKLARTDQPVDLLDRRNPTSPDFLRPRRGSPLADGGGEEPDLLPYIGAKPPRDEDSSSEDSQDLSPRPHEERSQAP